MKRCLSFYLALVCMVTTLCVGTLSASPAPAVEAAASKLVAFTFDDGPSSHTTRLLDGLSSLGAKATFFVNGTNGSMGAVNHSAKLSRMVAEGHQVANHTYSHHVPFGNLSASSIKSEVNRVNTYLYNAAGGSYQSLVRTPGGATSTHICSNIAAPVILWSVDTLDWKYRNATTVYNNILNQVGDGSVVLLHDIYSTSVTGALNAMKVLKSRGYEFVTVSELFRRRGISMKNGTVYRSAPNKGTTLPAYVAPTVTYGMSDQLGKALVTLSTANSGITLRYTLDGSAPTLASPRYTSPFVAPYGAVLTVAGFDRFGTRTPMSRQLLERTYEEVFDAAFYAACYPELQAQYGNDENALLDHFLSVGLAEGRQGNPIFCASYYRAHHRDLQQLYGDDLSAYMTHFLKTGIHEGRRASEHFDPLEYCMYYPDLRAAYKKNWYSYYMHYLRRGISEGRSGTPGRFMRQFVTVYDGMDYAAVYDYNVYISKYPEVFDTYGCDDLNVLRHFVEVGMREQRMASDSFSITSYYLRYPDLRRAFSDNWGKYYRHYINNGIKEGRQGIGCDRMYKPMTVYKGIDYAAVYDYHYYTAHHPQVLRTYGENDAAILHHFVTNGMRDGEQASERFNVYTYRERYAELHSQYGRYLPAYYCHYIKTGIHEGRSGI